MVFDWLQNHVLFRVKVIIVEFDSLLLVLIEEAVGGGYFSKNSNRQNRKILRLLISTME